MSHTPGPWKLSPEEWPDCGGYQAPQVFSYAKPDAPQYVAEIAVRMNWEKNGNLIAAAPELLYALKEACVALGERSLALKFYGVIRKAEGRS